VGHAKGYGECTRPRFMARVRITASFCSTERTSLGLRLGSSSDVTASVRLRFSVEEGPG